MDSIVKPQVLRVMLSSALYWAWIFLLYWSAALLGPEDALFFGKGAAFCGSALALLVWYAFVRTGKQRLSEIALVRAVPYALTPLAGLGSLVNAVAAPLPLPAVVVLWFLTGYGAAFVLTRMARAFNRLGKENSLVIMFVSLFISCLIAVFTSALPAGGAAPAVVMALAPLAACALAPFARDRLTGAESGADGLGAAPAEGERGALEGHGAAGTHAVFASKEAKRAFAVSWVQLLFYSVVFSFALLVGLNADGGGMPTVFVWFGAFLAGLLIMVYGMWLNARANIDLVQYVLLGITVVGLAPLTLASQVPDALRFASCVLLMFGFTSYDMMSLSQLLSMIEAQEVPFYRYFAFGRFANALGVFVGWVLAEFVFAFGAAFAGEAVAQLLPLALIVVLVIIIMVCSYGGKASSESAASAAAPLDPQGVWKRGCEELCEEHGLSARECEVFALYAKGRDSTYICNTLYISAHTVKSHIYHIYGKIGIHSQQELISMVEERAHELKKGGGTSPRI